MTPTPTTPVHSPRITREWWLACRFPGCGATEGIRAFIVGPRCGSHSPSALVGQPEPDALAAQARAARDDYQRSREAA